jgi:hypothetical protein
MRRIDFDQEHTRPIDHQLLTECAMYVRQALRVEHTVPGIDPSSKRSYLAEQPVDIDKVFTALHNEQHRRKRSMERVGRRVVRQAVRGGVVPRVDNNSDTYIPHASTSFTPYALVGGIG